jgi:hypothetical protein
VYTGVDCYLLGALERNYLVPDIIFSVVNHTISLRKGKIPLFWIWLRQLES